MGNSCKQRECIARLLLAIAVIKMFPVQAWGQAVAFSPDGSMIATPGISLWETQNMQRMEISSEDTESCVAFSPDGQLLAGGQELDEGFTVTLWDTSTGIVRRHLMGSEYTVFHIAFSPNGKLLAAGSLAVKVWEVDTGKLRLALPRGRDVTCVAFSPDGKTLAVSEYNDGPVFLYDVRTGRRVGALIGHHEDVLALAFSADGKLLASAGRDHVIRIWDARAHRILRVLPGHADSHVNCLAFSPQDHTLASVGGELKLWNCDNGSQTGEMKGPEGTIAFSPDGKRLAWQRQGKVSAPRMVRVATILPSPTPSFAGKWAVSPGPLTLHQSEGRVEGSYGFFDGRLEGHVSSDGMRVSGTWTQSNGRSGGFTFTISAKSDEVRGLRWSGDQPSQENSSEWSGDRIGEPQFRPEGERFSLMPASPQAKQHSESTAAIEHREVIEGVWRVEELQHRGRTATDQRRTLYRFAKGRLTVEMQGQPSANLQYSINTQQIPRLLDLLLTAANGKQISPMIYQLEADQLTICYSPPGHDRPTDFSGAGQNTLIHFRRIAKP